MSKTILSSKHYILKNEGNDCVGSHAVDDN